ncbi:hypothetical protein [Streptomyces sp. SLBN-134]|uniref:hypothetical protein n=1 Tax=Streptomyces sp. SLBN-134 TaxID=2768456 RepID=UPI00115125D0|nr:hypothetical protein [Streptomyces sp. SLBN-134]
MDAAALALVTASANSLIALMTSEVWEKAKEGVVALFRRKGEGESATIENELNESARELSASIENGDADTVEELRQQWRGKFRRLVVAHPDLASELNELLREWNSLPAGGAGVPVINQTATARDHGRVYQQGTGNQFNN